VASSPKRHSATTKSPTTTVEERRRRVETERAATTDQALGCPRPVSGKLEACGHKLEQAPCQPKRRNAGVEPRRALHSSFRTKQPLHQLDGTGSSQDRSMRQNSVSEPPRAGATPSPVHGKPLLARFVHPRNGREEFNEQLDGNDSSGRHHLSDLTERAHHEACRLAPDDQRRACKPRSRVRDARRNTTSAAGIPRLGK